MTLTSCLPPTPTSDFIIFATDNGLTYWADWTPKQDADGLSHSEVIDRYFPMPGNIAWRVYREGLDFEDEDMATMVKYEWADYEEVEVDGYYNVNEFID